MFMGIHFIFYMCGFVNFIFKFNIYVFLSGLKNPKTQKMTYLHF